MFIYQKLVLCTEIYLTIDDILFFLTKKLLFHNHKNSTVFLLIVVLFFVCEVLLDNVLKCDHVLIVPCNQKKSRISTD